MNANVKGSRPTQRFVLTLIETLALDELVVAEYAKSDKNYVDFAEWVNQSEHKLKFRFAINSRHIATACEARKIPSNRPRVMVKDKDHVTLVQRVNDLEIQVNDLIKRLHSIERAYLKL